MSVEGDAYIRDNEEDGLRSFCGTALGSCFANLQEHRTGTTAG
jgi:hypothetical protein